ncbi:MAG: extracellular solute-binding protein [Clostridiales bacterium]|nr:extracellular solute-binding protein [Clostridiales bacterium]
MKTKKILSLVIAAVMAVGGLSGCGTEKNASVTKDGKVALTVGNWPDKEANPQEYEAKMEEKTRFEEKYPDIEVVPDNWAYDIQTFAAKAEGETLPIIYNTFFTEAKKIIDLGYAADITDAMKEYGYYDVVSDEIMNEISRDDKVYMIPANVYTLGLVMNLNLFREAGLMNADGTPMFPQTFDEVRSMAKTIHDKTGKAGFVFPTTQNGGGWNFTALAWNFGGTFMKENGDKWEAAFNQGTTDALQWLQDMMWEDGSMPATTLVSNDDTSKLVGTDQAAMMFAHPGQVDLLVSQYGMNTENIGYAAMPAGPDRHVTLMGGNYYAIAPQATAEQIDAAFKWLEFTGATPAITLTEDAKESLREQYKTKYDENRYIIGIKDLSIWTDKEATQKYKEELIEEFRNIDEKNISSYNEKKDEIEYQTEEKICAQDLYGLLDSCIQEVLTNKDADCGEVLNKAASDFQNNFLNNM